MMLQIRKQGVKLQIGWHFHSQKFFGSSNAFPDQNRCKTSMVKFVLLKYSLTQVRIGLYPSNVHKFGMFWLTSAGVL